MIQGKQNGAKHVFQGIYRPKTVNLRRDRKIFQDKMFNLRDELFLQSQLLYQQRQQQSLSTKWTNNSTNNTSVYPSANITNTNSIYPGNGAEMSPTPLSIFTGLINKKEMSLYMIPYLKHLYETSAATLNHQAQINLHIPSSMEDHHYSRTNTIISNTNIEVYLTQFFHKHQSNAKALLEQIRMNHQQQHHHPPGANNNINNYRNNNNHHHDLNGHGHGSGALRGEAGGEWECNDEISET
jgi:hypothetical protein